MQPVLQVALDFAEMKRALQLAQEAVAGGADWLEAGTPLIKSEGLEAVRALRAAFPGRTLVADMKIMDAGRAEMEMAAKAGANIVVVLGVAADTTIQECIEAGRNYGARVAVDLLGVSDPVTRAQQVEEWGAHFVIYHTGIDEQMSGAARAESLARLRAVAAAVRIPVAAAGGITAETATDTIAAGAAVLIVGGAIIKSADAAEATRRIRHAMTTGEKMAGTLFRRVGEVDIRSILESVSTPNLSDGSHRLPAIVGLVPISPGTKLVGTALTVRTAPGDWAKPVEAIDEARPGDVLVIAAGGCPPAVWGELATHSARQRGLAGVVIDGGIRDTPEIRKLHFPAFARVICSHAGEPKGWGEIGAPVRIDGILVETGDWILGDDDGLVVLPQRRAAEMANRAMDCLEAENRIRQEIQSGQTTLGRVKELLKWEKR